MLTRNAVLVGVLELSVLVFLSKQFSQFPPLIESHKISDPELLYFRIILWVLWNENFTINLHCRRCEFKSRSSQFLQLTSAV